jgi:hypothetical protein
VFSFPEGGTGRYLAPGHSAEENAQSWVDIVFSSGDWQKPMTGKPGAAIFVSGGPGQLGSILMKEKIILSRTPALNPDPALSRFRSAVCY